MVRPFGTFLFVVGSLWMAYYTFMKKDRRACGQPCSGSLIVEPFVVLVTDGGRRLGDRAADTQLITVESYQP